MLKCFLLDSCFDSARFQEQEHRVSVLRARSKQLQPLVGAAVEDDDDGDDAGPRFAGKRAPVPHEPLEGLSEN